MINKLTKYGLLLFLIMGLIAFVIIATNQIDDNGKIGALIIDISVFFGIGIAFIIRGRQQDEFGNWKPGVTQ